MADTETERTSGQAVSAPAGIAAQADPHAITPVAAPDDAVAATEVLLALLDWSHDRSSDAAWHSLERHYLRAVVPVLLFLSPKADLGQLAHAVERMTTERLAEMASGEALVAGVPVSVPVRFTAALRGYLDSLPGWSAARNGFHADAAVSTHNAVTLAVWLAFGQFDITDDVATPVAREAEPASDAQPDTHRSIAMTDSETRTPAEPDACAPSETLTQDDVSASGQHDGAEAETSDDPVVSELLSCIDAYLRDGIASRNAVVLRNNRPSMLFSDGHWSRAGAISSGDMRAIGAQLLGEAALLDCVGFFASASLVHLGMRVTLYRMVDELELHFHHLQAAA